MSNRRGKTTAILQARMTSSRLPGKVLKPIEREPMLIRPLERIGRAATLDQIVVATSFDPSDDALVEVLTQHQIDFVRGPLSDVLARYMRVADQYLPDVIVRLTGDCPLTCPEVIDAVVQHFHESDADYASNTLDPTYPDGLDVEVVTTAALRAVSAATDDPHEREHVTLGVYRRDSHFRLSNYSDPTGLNHSDLRWTVDDAEDFEFVSHVYQSLLPRNSHFGYREILRCLEENPALNRTRRHGARNAALDGLDTGAMDHRGRSH